MQETKLQIKQPRSSNLKSFKQLYSLASNLGIRKWEIAKACGISRTALYYWEHDGMQGERLAIINKAMDQLIRQKKKALLNAI